MKKCFINLVVTMTVFFDVINVAKSSRTNKISTNDLGGCVRIWRQTRVLTAQKTEQTFYKAVFLLTVGFNLVFRALKSVSMIKIVFSQLQKLRKSRQLCSCYGDRHFCHFHTFHQFLLLNCCIMFLFQKVLCDSVVQSIF